MATPSVAVVDETCRAACKAMKLQSKQLLMLSASYSKLSFDGDEILRVLAVTMESLQNIQESLTKAAKRMKLDLDETTVPRFPDTMVVTVKEYEFLNAVFQEYITITLPPSSKEFSLFCSSSDICAEARSQCQDNAEKSKDS